MLISGMPTNDHQFVLADHMAFRTSTLDDLRTIGARLADAGIEGIIPISHGNAWSLYFNDPEGNGLECFVDTPFHVAQPYAEALDIEASNEEIEAATRADIESKPEFGSFTDWQAAFAERLGRP
ncbi:MAG: VOC family protein [Actinomycetota bacterium]